MNRSRVAYLLVIALLTGVVGMEIHLARNYRLVTGDQTYRYMRQAIALADSGTIPQYKQYPGAIVPQAALYKVFGNALMPVQLTSVTFVAVLRVLTVTSLAAFLWRLTRSRLAIPSVIILFYIYPIHYTVYPFAVNLLHGLLLVWTAVLAEQALSRDRRTPWIWPAMTVALACLTRFESVLLIPAGIVIICGYDVASRTFSRTSVHKLVIFTSASLAPIFLWWLAVGLATGTYASPGHNPAVTLIQRHPEIFNQVDTSSPVLRIIVTQHTGLFVRALWANLTDFFTRFVLRPMNFPLVLLSLCGIALALRARKFPALVAWLMILATFPANLLTQMESRQLLNWSYALLFFTGYLICALAADGAGVLHGRPGIRRALAAGLLVACIAVYVPFSIRNYRIEQSVHADGLDVVRYVRTHYAEAAVLVAAGRPAVSAALGAHLPDAHVYMFETTDIDFPKVEYFLERDDQTVPAVGVVDAAQWENVNHALSTKTMTPRAAFGRYRIVEIR